MNNLFCLQFSFGPLVWMFHSRTNNNKINRLHKRCLRIVYKNKQSSFNELLEIGASASINTRNIQILPTGIYKLINNLLAPIMNRVFKLNSDLRCNSRR